MQDEVYGGAGRPAAAVRQRVNEAYFEAICSHLHHERTFGWKAACDNDGDKNPHGVVRDRGYVKLGHVGFEMPSAFVVFIEPSGDRIASSGFDARP